MLFGQKPCPDCEPAQVNHFVIRTGAYLGLALKPALRPIDALIRALAPRNFSLFDTAGPLALRALALARLGRLHSEPTADDSDRTRCLMEEARRREIEIKHFKCGALKDLFIARHGDKTRCFDGLPRPVGREATSLAWMDNKPKMRARFAEAGIPIARGASVFTEREALRVFRSLTKPAIVKPHSGSRSRHTTIHIEIESELRIAFRKAKQLSPFALIEEELVGFVYRGTLIGGKLVAVMRREPPHIVGDGAQSVRALVETENKRPERYGKTFHPIAAGADAAAELVRQGLLWESVPKRGELVTLHQKISRGVGASTTDVTREIHPDNRALLLQIGTVLKDPLVGVDFIISDVARSWRVQKQCGVIECNSLPFIDLHHYPLNGPAQNVAGALWDLIFPASDKKRT